MGLQQLAGGPNRSSVQCNVPVRVLSFTPTQTWARALRAARPICSVAGDGTSTALAARRRNAGPAAGSVNPPNTGPKIAEAG